MKFYGPERAEENKADDDYARELTERDRAPPIEEQRFNLALRNLYRSRHLIASALDELIKTNEHLKSLRTAAWLIVWLLIGLVALGFWRRW
jgi:hypothetical protein